jgi:hypothetical protein
VPTTPAELDGLLRRIDALLAKAGATTFPAEAEAFLGKAQELMTRHSIDESLLRGTDRTGAEIITETVVVEPPYASARTSLLGQVARANGCRLVVSTGGRGSQRCSLLGRQADVDGTRLLFTALSLQATRSMLATPVPDHDTARRFRHAFLLGFAHRIGERLRAAVAAAQHEAESRIGQGAGLVLVRRETEVEAALRAQFPFLTTRRATASSSAGAHHGRRAAESASLGQRGLRGAGRALPSA